MEFRNDTDPKEQDSIDHCKDSDYKYKIFYAVGQTYIYPDLDSIDDINAVSRIFYM